MIQSSSSLHSLRPNVLRVRSSSFLPQTLAAGLPPPAGLDEATDEEAVERLEGERLLLRSSLEPYWALTLESWPPVGGGERP